MSAAVGDSPLASALERFTIPELWQLLGLSGMPQASCRSPFREDKNPSFTIYAGDRRWCDHGTGEGGDAVDFVAQAYDLSKSEAARKLIELAGTRGRGRPWANHHQQPRPASAKYDSLADKEKAHKREGWPVFAVPRKRRSRQSQSFEACRLKASPWPTNEGCSSLPALERGPCLGHYRQPPHERAGQKARRQAMGGKDSKAWTLPGSVGGWVIGLREAAAFPSIALVEGGPDLLAAFHLAWCATSTPETLALGKGADVLGNLGVVAIFGAKTRIIDAALPLFAGKRVRIFAHDDTSGYSAAATWAATLKAAGAALDSFGFTGFCQSDGCPVSDLNDFARIDPDQWESERALIESAFDFVPANPPPSLKKICLKEFLTLKNRLARNQTCALSSGTRSKRRYVRARSWTE